MTFLSLQARHFALLLLAILIGCVSPGASVDPASFDLIREGRSTRADVEKVFGPPHDLLRGSGGFSVAIYSAGESYSVPKMGGVGFRFRRRIVSFLYAPEGVVARKLYSERMSRMEATKLQPLASGTPFNLDDLARVIRPDVDADTLEQILGPASCEVLDVSGGSVLLWFSLVQKKENVLAGKAEFDQQIVDVLLSPDRKVRTYRVSGVLEGARQGLPSPLPKPRRQML